MAKPKGLSFRRKSIPLTALFPAGEQASSPLVLRDVYTAGTLEDAMEKAFGQ